VEEAKFFGVLATKNLARQKKAVVRRRPSSGIRRAPLYRERKRGTESDIAAAQAVQPIVMAATKIQKASARPSWSDVSPRVAIVTS